MTEKELIENIVAGQDKLFEQIVEKYENMVLGVITSFCGKRSDTEDIAQSVFVKVFFSLKKFQFASSLSTWIYRITINEAINFSKKKKHQFVPLSEVSKDDDEETDFIDSLENKRDNIEKQAVQKEEQLLVRKAMEQLQDNYRTILTLRDIEDLSYDEIAQILNISQDKVKIWLFRARKKLKDILVKEGNFNELQ